MQHRGWGVTGAAVFGLLCACGSSSQSKDAAVDTGSVDVSLTDSSGADTEPASATLMITISNKSGTNVATTTFGIPYQDVASKGLGCNANTAPTLCSYGATDNTGSAVLQFSSFMDMQSLGDGTTNALMPGGSAQTGAAILNFLEGNMRWEAQSGSFVLDSHSGNRASAHWSAQMGPHSVAPAGATGTFQLDAVVVNANYYNP